MSSYVHHKQIRNFPRVPLSGSIDFTYRCNNHCLHCWINIPIDAEEKNHEMPFDEIIKIVEDARRMGCSKWSISGGEPMLRDDFIDLFDYMTQRLVSYSITTNGTLITPKIAKLMKRMGMKRISMYGATADVHDHITRNPGSYESMLRGIAYLKEAGAGFTVQIVPMKDNYHQYEVMQHLADDLSSNKKLGASWLYLSATGDKKRNKTIEKQRLDPSIIVHLDPPEIYDESTSLKQRQDEYGSTDQLFSCIQTRRSFYVDPYGKATFCLFIKEPEYQYDLKKGSINDFWDNHVQQQSLSLKRSIEKDKAYKKGCGSCKLRTHCNWCPVYAYLEKRRFSEKVDYLCKIAKQAETYRNEWEKQHRVFYKIAGITIQVESDLPINEKTFHSKFKPFQTSGPGRDTIKIKHHFFLPDIIKKDLGKEVYHKIPWAIYRKEYGWIYVGISEEKQPHQLAEFNHDHTHARIYSDEYRKDVYLKGNVKSLTLFPTDQVLLARLLADRDGFYIHSSGVIFNGSGLLFAGKSGAGKTTIAKILKDHSEILCDDRMIIRKHGNMYRVYGSWSHGDLPDVSSNCAPLKGIFFLEQSSGNKIEPIDDKNEILKILLGVLIRPFVTIDWWEKTIGLLQQVVSDVPFYRLSFDKSDRIVKLLMSL